MTSNEVIQILEQIKAEYGDQYGDLYILTDKYYYNTLYNELEGLRAYKQAIEECKGFHEVQRVTLDNININTLIEDVNNDISKLDDFIIYEDITDTTKDADLVQFLASNFGWR